MRFQRQLFVLLLSVLPLAGGQNVRVMSFNIWVGGDAGKQPLSQTLEVIRSAKADIVGLQESRGYRKGTNQPDNGENLAKMLGWNYFYQGRGRGIISRFAIVTNTAGKSGVLIQLSANKNAWIFNMHFNHAPYQPYQLLNIPYANAPFIKTAEEAISEAKKARGQEVELLISELAPALESKLPVFLTGDFNEPSHLDWTPRAAKAGKCPLPVEYPTTLAISGTGLRDAFRTVYSDEIRRPGHTWTPTTQPNDPKDRHDRIDFVFYNAHRAVAKTVQIIGEDKAFADVVVQPYPSDHRGVVGEFEVN